MLGIFIDIESTGLDPIKHRMLEIAFKIIDLNSGELRASYESIIKRSETVWNESDPISLKVNGFKWEDLKDGKSEEVVAKEIITLFKDLKISNETALYIGQNPSFDRSLFSQIISVYNQNNFNWPYHWLDLASMFWGGLLKESFAKNSPLPEEIPLSKNAIAKHYNLPEEDNPHKAMNGVNHLLLCYERVVGFLN